MKVETTELGEAAQAAKRSEKCPYFLRDLAKHTEKRNGPVNCNKKLPQCTIKELTVFQLPVEILAMIFSHVNTTDRVALMRVCKYWSNILKSPVLWQHLELKSSSTMNTASAIAVLKMSPLLKSAKILNGLNFEQLLTQICKTNRLIEDLVLTRCPCPIHYPSLQSGIRKCCDEHQCKFRVTCASGFIRSQVVLNMLKHCQQLKSLKFVNVIIQSNKFYKQLGVSMKHLTKLCISHCICFTELHLHSIVESCDNIQEFTLLGVGGSTNGFWDLKWEVAYQLMLKKWGATLTHLELSVGHISDIVLQGLDNCSRLKKLWLEFCYKLDYGGITSIAKLNHLEDLYISHCRNINVYTFGLINENNFKSLKILSLKSSIFLDDDCLTAIAIKLPLLEKVDLARCILVSDVGLASLLKCCPRLNELNLYEAVKVRGNCFTAFDPTSLRLKVIIDATANVERMVPIVHTITEYPGIKLQCI